MNELKLAVLKAFLQGMGAELDVTEINALLKEYDEELDLICGGMKLCLSTALAKRKITEN